MTKLDIAQRKVKEFLDTEALKNSKKSFSALDISKIMYDQSCSYVTRALKELLANGDIKQVDFKYNGRPYPMYQSSIGSLPAVEVIDEDSEEYQKLNLVSVSALCKERRLLPNSTLKIFEIIKDEKVRKYNTYNKAKGYFLKFKRAKLEEIIDRLMETGEIAPSPGMNEETLITLEEISEHLQLLSYLKWVRRFTYVYRETQESCKNCKCYPCEVEKSLNCPNMINKLNELIQKENVLPWIRRSTSREEYITEVLRRVMKEYVTSQTSKKANEEKILAFLKKETSGYKSFTKTQIFNLGKIWNNAEQFALKSLLLEKKIKIVNFTRNGRPPSPFYQIASGKFPAIPIIEKDSKEYKRLNLITVFSFQHSYKMNGLSNTQLLNGIRKRGIKPVYVIGSNGYSENYRVQDLKDTVNWLSPSSTSNSAQKKEILEAPQTPTKLEPIQEVAQKPIILPDIQTKEAIMEKFKPRSLFKKVFNLFGYKLNFNVTIEKRKTIANTGQDLIEF